MISMYNMLIPVLVSPIAMHSVRFSMLSEFPEHAYQPGGYYILLTSSLNLV